MPTGDGGKLALSERDLDNLGTAKAAGLGIAVELAELEVNIARLEKRRAELVKMYSDRMFTYETLVSSMVSANGFDPEKHTVDFERGEIVPTLGGIFDDEEVTVPATPHSIMEMDRRRGECVTPRGGMEGVTIRRIDDEEG